MNDKKKLAKGNRKASSE